MRPALLRCAVSLQLPHLALFHGLRRLQELQQQLQAALPGGGGSGSKPQQAPARPPERAGAPPAAQAVGVAAAPGTPASLQAPARQLLLRNREPMGGGLPSANPAAALVAATRASPDAKARGQPASSSSSGSKQELTRQQLLGAAATVGEAAGAAAAALCTLRNPASIRGLQSFCRQAFQPLLRALEQPVLGAPGAAGSGGGGVSGSGASNVMEEAEATVKAAMASVAAWEWLSPVALHAEGRYEEAVWQYLSYSSASRPFVHKPTIWQLTAAAYSAVGNVAGLTAWQQQQAAGARLPPPVVARYLDLASWDVAPVLGSAEQRQEQVQPPLHQLLLQGMGGSTSLREAAASLAELSLVAGGHSLPADLLLPTVPSTEPITAWQQHSGHSNSNGRTGGQLLPLGLLLKGCVSSRGTGGAVKLPLLLVAAGAAATTGNSACAGRLLTEAEVAAAGSPVGKLCVRLSRLQLQAEGGKLEQLSGLLLDAQATWPALVPATASSIVQAAAAGPPGTGAAQAEAALQQLAGLARGVTLPGAALRDLSVLEQRVLEPGSATAGVQYSALKAAVAAAPDSAQQWWELASWLGNHIEGWQDGAAGAADGGSRAQAAQQAHAATFLASCKALSLASSTGGRSSRGSATLPLLLQTLRLLREQSAALPPELLAAGLGLVPATAWLPLVPQLLAQLASSSGSGGGPTVSAQQAVRQVALAVAAAAPWAVLLPGLAGLDGREDVPGSAAGLAAVVEEVQQQHPELAAELQSFAGEMARLAVLPEEHWHSVLLEAAALAAKHLAELSRDQQPQAELAAAAMAPLLLALEQHLVAAPAGQGGQVAAQAPPHEQQFAAKVLPRLRQLLLQVQQEALRSTAPAAAAAAEPGATLAGWQKVAQLLKRGAADMASLLSVRQMELSSVSPALAAWQGSSIPMPGAAPGPAGEVVTVAGLEAIVAVLHTKTRPKKLVLLGSDGRSYNFLLKASVVLPAQLAWIIASSV